MSTKYLNDQGIDIARGLVGGVSCINKFGYHGGDVAASTVETVWDGNANVTIMPYPSAGVITITDNSTDTGENVVVQGLDADYNLQSETVAVGGTGTLTFSRVFRAFMESTENGDDVGINQGGTFTALIKAGLGQTQMAVYTVPAGKMAFLTKIHGSSDRSTGNPAVQFRLKVREFGSIFRIKGTYGTAGGNQFDYEYSVPLMFDEKSDIRIDVLADAAVKCGAIFDLKLVDYPPAKV